MLHSTTKRGVIAAGATVIGSLLYPALALAADPLTIMGANAGELAVRVGGGLLVLFLIWFVLRDTPGRNFAGLAVGFVAFCIATFAVLTPGKAIGVAAGIGDELTKGIPARAGYGSGAPSGSAPASGGAPSRGNAGP